MGAVDQAAWSSSSPGSTRDEKQAEEPVAYVQDGVLAAPMQSKPTNRRREVNAAGYCLGGTLLATTCAYLAAKRQKHASATFFTTMTDFSEPGELGVFTDEGRVASLEERCSERLS